MSISVEASRPPISHLKVLRFNLLAIVGATLLASFLGRLEGFPFHTGFCAASLASCLMHLGAFLAFNRVSDKPWFFELLVHLNLLIMGFIIHFSGGLASPFIFFYFWILASPMFYGIKDRYGVFTAIATFTGITAAEVFGLLEPWGAAAAGVYASPLVASIIFLAVVFFMLMTRFISEMVLTGLRAQLERETSSREAMLKKFNELSNSAAIGAVAHRIVHDLKGPLSSALGYVSMELRTEKDPERVQNILQVKDSILQMSEMLVRITRYGKQAGSASEALDMAEFLRSMVSLVSLYPESAEIRFRTSFPRDRVCVHAVRRDLQQAFFNILKNAVESFGEGRRGAEVEVALMRSGDKAVITVSDNGPGVPQAVLEYAFLKPVSGKADGTGVGLISTADNVRQNHGTIEIRNRGEGGCAVTVVFPLAKT